MANRIQRTVLMLLVTLLFAPMARGQEDATLIDPRIERRPVSEAQIDSENIELGLYTGLLAVDNFNTPPLLGARVGWHISEDIFFEMALAEAKTGKTSFEKLGGGAVLLEDSERRLRYLNLSVGYNILPGEAFAGRQRAFTNGLYLLAGAGSTRFAGDDRFTIHAGAGYRLLLNDWLTVRMEMRDHVFELDLFGREEVTHNLEWSVGLGTFF